jgi:hypothetical protein
MPLLGADPALGAEPVSHGVNGGLSTGDPPYCGQLSQFLVFVHRTNVLEAQSIIDYCTIVRRNMRRPLCEAGMNDIKVKRAARESARSEAAAPLAEPASVSPPAETASAAPPAPMPPAAQLDIARIAAPVAPAVLAPTKSAPTAGMAPSDDMFAYGQQSWAALAEAQAAAARGFEALVGEMTDFTRSEMAAAANTATAMLGVKTFAEAVEVNLGFARRSFDALIGSAAKLSEIGAKAAAETSRPILSRLG